MVLLSFCAQAGTLGNNDDTIIVRSSTIESTTVNELADYGNKLQVITREEIQRSGPSSDLNRVLQQYVRDYMSLWDKGLTATVNIPLWAAARMTP